MKAIVLAAVMAAGCTMAPVDREAMEYTRADARLRAIEQFEVLKQACRAAGGVIYMDRTWGRRFAPRPSEMRTAKCGTPLWPGRS